jgi:hypothetical protein
MVVVAGHDHHLSPGSEHRPQLDEEVAPRSERLPQRTVAQLEYVSEEDDAVDTLEFCE